MPPDQIVHSPGQEGEHLHVGGAAHEIEADRPDTRLVEADYVLVGYCRIELRDTDPSVPQGLQCGQEEVLVGGVEGRADDGPSGDAEPIGVAFVVGNRVRLRLVSLVLHEREPRIEDVPMGVEHAHSLPAARFRHLGALSDV